MKKEQAKEDLTLCKCCKALITSKNEYIQDHKGIYLCKSCAIEPGMTQRRRE